MKPAYVVHSTSLRPGRLELLMACLRFWRRERRWERKQTRMFCEADVLVITHTKSGQTWLRVMLSHIFHLLYAVPADEVIQFDNFHRRDRHIPKIHFTRDNRFVSRSGRCVLARPSPSQKLLFLVRDPRDVALSYWFHIRHRASDKELHFKGIGKAAREVSAFDFAANEVCGVHRVTELYNRWLEESAAFPQVHFTRYEDLLANTKGELEEILRFIGVEAGEEEIGTAVAFASFDNMKRMEQDEFFKSERLRATVPGNPDSMKVRSGEVGALTKMLNSEQGEWINGLLAQKLNPRFGYRAQPTPEHAHLLRRIE